MKKLLLLGLAMLLNPNVEAIGNPSERVEGANIEMFVEEIPYVHPRAKEVGDLMPQHTEEEIRVSLMDMFRLNKITGIRKVIGVVLGYDRDGDFIPEYEFMNRFCDSKSGVKTYAVYDTPHKLLYIDAARDNYIDLIVKGIDNIESTRFPMIPIKCKKEKLNDSRSKWQKRII